VIRFIPDQNTLVNALRAHDVDSTTREHDASAARPRSFRLTFVTVRV